MTQEIGSNIRQQAEESFSSGMYCAESVVSVLAKAQGIDSELVPKLATAFCSGMARTCGTCGALTGAIMGVSLALGRSQAGESVQPAYEATQKLVHEFETRFGAKDCHVLLGCDLATAQGQATFREQGLDHKCRTYTGVAAQIAATVIAELHGTLEPVVTTHIKP